MDHVAQYSSSSSSEDESQRCPRPSKKPRIPFPTALLGDPPPVAQGWFGYAHVVGFSLPEVAWLIRLYVVNYDCAGAPDERDALGRVRAFPHAAGNWATHLFIQGTRTSVVCLCTLSMVMVFALNMRVVVWYCY